MKINKNKSNISKKNTQNGLKVNTIKTSSMIKTNSMIKTTNTMKIMIRMRSGKKETKTTRITTRTMTKTMTKTMTRTNNIRTMMKIISIMKTTISSE